MPNNRRYNEESEVPLTKSQRRAFRNPWFWAIVAALVIIPFTVGAVLSHDDFNNTMKRQGCHVINQTEEGTRIWRCPVEVE